jgi:hypothetical protein
MPWLSNSANGLEVWHRVLKTTQLGMLSAQKLPPYHFSANAGIATAFDFNQRGYCVLVEKQVVS